LSCWKWTYISSSKLNNLTLCGSGLLTFQTAFTFFTMESHHNLLSTADKESDNSSDYCLGKEYYRETENVRKGSVRRMLLVALLSQLIFLFYGTFLFIKSLPPSKIYPGIFTTCSPFLTEPYINFFPDIYDGLDLREHAQKMTRHSKFDGRPSAETNKAWHDLLDGITSNLL
jgi:hypothetical protein